MAKGRKKGPGRGRRGAAIDPATGRFLKTKTAAPAAAAAATQTEPVPAAAVAVAVPSGPTTTPEEVTQEISGFRKALMQTMKDLGGDQTEIQDALLEGLRKTAEEIVQQNKDIFGEKMEKTVDQSAAYEIFEKVVDLSEQAAKARTVEQKRKILQRLQTFKRVTQNVFKGGGKQGEVAKKLLEIIEKIEEPLKKETGIKAAAKEKITDYMKELPERMAAKIPLIGGIVSRSLKRRREKKEEEAEALSTLTEEISRAGRTSLYGRRGAEIGASPTGIPDAEPPMPGEPPIPGGSTVAEITGSKNEKSAFNKQTLTTLKSILISVNDIRAKMAQQLVSVNDIRQLMFDQLDPAEQELKAEEAAREEANAKLKSIGKLSNFMGKGGGGAAAPAAAEGGGIISSLLNFFGLGGLAETLGAVASTIGGIATTLGSMVAGVASTLGGLAMTVGSAVASTATAIGSAAVAAAPWVAAAAAGTAVGLGAAWLVNKGIDSVFGTDLSDRMFDSDTWTFADARRDAEREELGQKITAEHERQTSTPDYIYRASQDPRMLPKLVSDKKMTGGEALDALTEYEEKYGPGEDTKAIRQRIMELDPSLKSTVVSGAEGDVGTVEGTIVPAGEKNITQQTLNMLEQSQDALSAETMGPPAPVGVNTVVAPTTNNSNTTINNNSGNTGVRNNDPTLKAAERASL